ncbi:hypothetical protein ES703_90411 [subsurface metagenome]
MLGGIVDREVGGLGKTLDAALALNQDIEKFQAMLAAQGARQQRELLESQKLGPAFRHCFYSISSPLVDYTIPVINGIRKASAGDFVDCMQDRLVPQLNQPEGCNEPSYVLHHAHRRLNR